jgi:hypothetical protein
MILTPEVAEAEAAKGNSDISLVLRSALNPSSAEKNGVRIFMGAEPPVDKELLFFHVTRSDRVYAVPIDKLIQLAVDKQKKTGEKSEIYQCVEANVPPAKYIF